MITLELNKIMNLSIEHDLNLNSTKSKLMLFGSKNKVNIVKASLDIKIGSATLPIVDEAKCLEHNFLF